MSCQASSRAKPLRMHLQAQVVLLVDHQADGFLGRRTATPRGPSAGGEFAADELAFDEKLPVERRERRER